MMTDDITDILVSHPHEHSYPYASDGIEQPEQRQLEEAAQRIDGRAREMRRRLAEDIVCIGEELDCAHRILSRHGSGTWGRWVQERCGISRATAHRYMTIYRTWGDCRTLIQSSEITALWMVARDATATNEAKRLMTEGVRLTVSTAEQLLSLARHRRVLDRTLVDAIDPVIDYEASDWAASSPIRDEDLPDLTPAGPRLMRAEDTTEKIETRWTTAQEMKWTDTLAETRGDPTDCWRAAMYFDEEDFEADLISVVAYYWRLDKPGKHTKRIVDVISRLCAMVSGAAEAQREAGK